jgi:hypothetical protein
MTSTTPHTTDLPSFGAFVWWNFREIQITPTDLRACLSVCGLPGEVADLDATVETRALARSWRFGRGNADRFKTEIAHEDDATLTVGLLRREQVSDREVGWVQIDRLVWDKNGRSWASSGVSDEASTFRADALRAATLLDHNAVRPIAQAVLEGLAAFKLRDQGGFYFVPYATPGASETVAALQRLIAGLGRSSLLVAEQVTESAREAVAEEARETLGAALATMRGQIADWRAKARNARKDAVGNLLEDFKVLRERADLYADALRLRLDDLLGEIDEVREEARALLRDDGEKRPADGLVSILYRLVEDSTPDSSGEIMLSLTDLAKAGLPEAATDPARAERYWGSSSAGKRALTTLGFVGKVEIDSSGDLLNVLWLIPATVSVEQSAQVEQVEQVEEAAA